MPLDAEWLGQVARSETDKPHEWPYVMWVVRNRVETKRFPNTYPGVICQPLQFSYYNQYQHAEDEDAMYAEASLGYAGKDHDAVVGCAHHVLGLPRYHAPFSDKVYYFWSPISMSPPGRDPSWAKKLRVFEVSGVDPWRFKFAEEE